MAVQVRAPALLQHPLRKTVWLDLLKLTFTTPCDPPVLSPGIYSREKFLTCLRMFKAALIKTAKNWE